MIVKAPRSINQFGLTSGLYDIGFYYNGQTSDTDGDYYRFSCQDLRYGYSIFVCLNADATTEDAVLSSTIFMRQTDASYNVSNIVVYDVSGMLHQLMLWGYVPAIELARRYKIDNLIG